MRAGRSRDRNVFSVCHRPPRPPPKTRETQSLQGLRGAGGGQWRPLCWAQGAEGTGGRCSLRSQPGVAGPASPHVTGGCPPYPHFAFSRCLECSEGNDPKAASSPLAGGTLVCLAVCPPLRGTRGVASRRPRGSRSPRLSAAVCPAWGQGAARPGHLCDARFCFPGGRRQPPTQHPGMVMSSSQPHPRPPARLARARGLSGGHGDPVWLPD